MVIILEGGRWNGVRARVPEVDAEDALGWCNVDCVGGRQRSRRGVDKITRGERVVEKEAHDAGGGGRGRVDQKFSLVGDDGWNRGRFNIRRNQKNCCQ